MEIPISNCILDSFQLKNHEYLVDPTYYDLLSGQQEYRLYSYLTTFFDNSIILDIGTLNGRSAVSLSHNESNRVISYNIIDDIKDPEHRIYTKSNIEFRVKDVLGDLTPELVAKTKIVMIDIDHFEVVERKIIKRLDELGFSGIILLDDIHHPWPECQESMQRLWNSLQYDKYDISKYGHISGTGLVVMNSDIRPIYVDKIVFIHIPKTAGASITTTLDNVDALYYGTGRTHKFAKDVISDTMKNYPSMAVVRNPYDRLYSIYSFYSNMRDDIPGSITFEEFVLSYERKFVGRVQDNGHPHAFNQCFDYVSSNGKVIVSNIIHFENIDEEFRLFCTRYSIPASLVHVNQNPTKGTINKPSLYTEEMREVVERCFADDMTHFGYSYENWLEC